MYIHISIYTYTHMYMLLGPRTTTPSAGTRAPGSTFVRSLTCAAVYINSEHKFRERELRVALYLRAK